MTDYVLKKLWMPVTKSSDGKFVGILSDTSLDRDEEMMDGKLLKEWANLEVLPALVNHENKMEKFIGGWKNLRVIKKNGHNALVASPFFFSKEANPLADQVSKQLDEAVDNGLNPGISVGFIPSDSVEKDVDDKTHTVYTKGELVEATLVPIQSNRNASFGHVAKSFDFCLDNKQVENVEVEEMSEEEQPEGDAPEGKPSDAPAEEAAPEAPAEEAPPSEEAPGEEVPSEESKALSEALERIKGLEGEVTKLKTQAQNLKPTVEGPIGNVEKDEVVDVESMLKARQKAVGMAR
jgi:hypothetical protein